MGKGFETVGEHLHWSYANLALAHAAVSDEAPKYRQLHYIIRARLYKGLREGTMRLGSLADDERFKMLLPKMCCYCGYTGKLSLDHLIPKSVGGADEGDNLVWACRSCNSSKSNKDLLSWYERKEHFPPLMLLRRFLKLVIMYCTENELMGLTLDEASKLDLPFRLDMVPHKYPQPPKMKLFVEPADEG